MRDELLGYYERELAFLRRLGAQYAEQYPKIASRLVLEPDRCEDPHVERLLEGFALLAARVHLKVDDEFPEVTEALLSILYPHLLSPVPAMSILQFSAEGGNLQSGQVLPRGSTVVSRSVGATSCRFRTAYPVELWPLEVKSVRFELPLAGVSPEEARAALRLELRTPPGLALKDLRSTAGGEEVPLSRIRFFLNGEPKVVHALYEHLMTAAVAVDLRPGGGRDLPSPVRLAPDILAPVGFAEDESLLPAGERSFPGFRLLQEYFAFPEKFLFFDLTGLEALQRPPFTETFEILVHFSREFREEKGVSLSTFRLNCSPVVNLFRQTAEPIRLTHYRPEYPVIPDVRRQDVMEVFSVDAVRGAVPGTARSVEYLPFYSFRHGDTDGSRTFWYAARRPSAAAEDEGSDIFLTLVDLDFRSSQPDVETLTVDLTCTNRNLPGRLPVSTGEGDFQVEGAGVFSGIRCLRKPTASLRLPLRRGLHWRLVSHLSLNVLSLVEGAGAAGPEALREMLRLYDFADSAAMRQQIAGISSVSARRVLRSVGVLQASFVKGLEVTVEFDEQQYVGSGAFLFASVLERFFALYASLNSFSQMVAVSRQREGVLKAWPPRAGDRILL